MTPFTPKLANTLWHASSYPAWRLFSTSTGKVKETQASILKNILKNNRDTSFGRRYKFGKLVSIPSYQASVPISTYEDYTADIERIGRGEKNVLSHSPVRLFELSSGSTSPSKLIPYTQQLQKEFQAGISAWIYNLFQNYPDLKDGPAYWSISPLVEGQKYTPGGIPISFEEDSAYLGHLGKRLLDPIMAVPGKVKNLTDIENFRYATLLYLLSQPNLRIISIWNPTFLSLLLEPMEKWWPTLIDNLKTGKVTLLDKAVNKEIFQINPNPRRARQMMELEPTQYMLIWPKLKLISCWMDGLSKSFAEDLRSQFPEVIFQGKGLISTEAFVSFPIVGLPGAVLAVNSHFFEFLPLDDNSQFADEKHPLLAHQLDKGQNYSVVVTTGGGFYRYHLQDIIEVVGFYKQIPLIRFIGKMDLVSDWFGEKLNERFVSRVLMDQFRFHNLQPSFALVAPSQTGGTFRYRLFLEFPGEKGDTVDKKELAKTMDDQLCRNFHYGYCRKLGQISPLDIYLVGKNAQGAYLAACKKRGQRLGDVKPRTLESSSGWEEHFILCGKADDRNKE